MRKRIRSLVCKVKSTRVSHHGCAGGIRRPARGGAPACFVLSPVNARGLSPSSPRYFSPPVGGEKSRPDFAGPHDLGRRGIHCHAMCCHPASQRTAWSVLRSRRWLTRPLYEERTLLPPFAPDAAAPPHPAPRIVTIASRPSMVRRDEKEYSPININVKIALGYCLRIRSNAPFRPRALENF